MNLKFPTLALTIALAPAALAKVPGVKANTAEKGTATFQVTGDFNAEAVFAALHQAGFAVKPARLRKVSVS